MGDENAHWLALSRVGGIGAVRFRTLLDTFGSIEAAWHATPEDLRGCHRLIENGARPLIAFEDVLEAINMEAAVMADHLPERLPEDETERSVIGCLSAEPVHVDELHIRSGLPVATLTATLALLELKGLVRQVGGMHYVRLREAGSPYRVD